MDVAADTAALSIEPSLDEVRELARTYTLVPLRHTFIDDCETPVSAFLKLRGRNPEYPAFLLESASKFDYAAPDSCRAALDAIRA